MGASKVASGWRHLPNIITSVRLGLLLPLTLALIREDYTLAFLLFLIAGISDGLDGYLARRFGWTTRFGATLDPAADKLLITLTYGLLTWHGHIPWWLFSIVFGRDILIVFGYFSYRFLIGPPSMTPLLISKANTAFQILFVSLVMLRLGTGVGWLDVETWGQWIVACLGVMSGAAYVWVWGRKAYANKLKKEGEWKTDNG